MNRKTDFRAVKCYMFEKASFTFFIPTFCIEVVKSFICVLLSIFLDAVETVELAWRVVGHVIRAVRQLEGGLVREVGL